MKLNSLILSSIIRLIHEHKRRMHIKRVFDLSDAPECLRFIDCNWCGAKTFIWMRADEMIPPGVSRSTEKVSNTLPIKEDCDRPFSPFYNSASDTVCTNCSQGLRDWFAPWYTIEIYADGCRMEFDKFDNMICSRGGSHAPHTAFRGDDIPIEVINRSELPLPPIIDRNSQTVGYFDRVVVKGLMGQIK